MKYQVIIHKTVLMIGEAKILSYLTTFPKIHQSQIFHHLLWMCSAISLGLKQLSLTSSQNPWCPQFPPFPEWSWGGGADKPRWAGASQLWCGLRGTACVLRFTVWHSICIQLYGSLWSPYWWDPQDYWSWKAFPGVIRKKSCIHRILITFSVKFYSLIV